jgi:hypothetical protein
MCRTCGKLDSSIIFTNLMFVIFLVLSSTLLTTHERLPRMGTARRKCMSGVRGLAQKMHVLCVSGFPCGVFIDSNHRDSRNE